MVSEPSPPTVIERVDACLVESRQQLVGAVDLEPRSVALLDGVRRGVALVRRPDDRAAQMGDATNALPAQIDQSVAAVVLGEQQPVETVADADDVPAPIAGGERHGTDDGVEPGRVTAAGTDGHTSDRLHACDSTRSRRSTLRVRIGHAATVNDSAPAPGISPSLDALPRPAERRLAVRVTPDALRHVRAGHPWVFADSITADHRRWRRRVTSP